MRNVLFLLTAMLLSAGLIISIPSLSILIGRTFTSGRNEQVRTTEVKRVTINQPRRERTRLQKQPRRRTTPRRSGKSGPRFAMALGTQGPGGAAVSPDIINRPSGSGGTGDQGVDERPELVGSVDLEIPDAVRQAERNATVRLLFCVDVAGKAYDIRVAEEEPAGLGLADAAVTALKQVAFKPAVRDGRSVPFCGMEQPIEINFRN